MKTRGINFDTGFLNKGSSTRESFDPDIVRREMQIIRDDLHCTAVRITGGDADRLEIAARHAADAGLEVWFCPFTNELTQESCSRSSPTARNAPSDCGRVVHRW